MVKNSKSCKCYVNSEGRDLSPCGEAKNFMWEAGHGVEPRMRLRLEKCPVRTEVLTRRHWSDNDQSKPDCCNGRYLFEKSGWDWICRGPEVLGLARVWFYHKAFGVSEECWPGGWHEEHGVVGLARHIWEDIAADLEFLYMMWYRDTNLSRVKD